MSASEGTFTCCGLSCTIILSLGKHTFQISLKGIVTCVKSAYSLALPFTADFRRMHLCSNTGPIKDGILLEQSRTDRARSNIIFVRPFCSSEKTKNHDITTGIVFRIFSNLFSHEKGRSVMSKQREEVTNLGREPDAVPCSKK